MINIPEEKFRTIVSFLLDEIIKHRSEEVAKQWFWSATPMPCGFPNQEQIERALELAFGDISVNDFFEREYRELNEAMDEINQKEKTWEHG